MKRIAIVLTFAVFSALATHCSYAQATAADMPAMGLAACGDMRAAFTVKQVRAGSASEATAGTNTQAGKAIVYFIERDLNTRMITHTTRAALDGHWIGATYGDSWFSFTVDPGVHHVCASTQTGSSPEDGNIELIHFTAEPGQVYYFQMKNTVMLNSGDATNNDSELKPLDSDEGEYLTKLLPPVVSKQKK